MKPWTFLNSPSHCLYISISHFLCPLPLWSSSSIAIPRYAYRIVCVCMCVGFLLRSLSWCLVLFCHPVASEFGWTCVDIVLAVVVVACCFCCEHTCVCWTMLHFWGPPKSMPSVTTFSFFLRIYFYSFIYLLSHFLVLFLLFVFAFSFTLLYVAHCLLLFGFIHLRRQHSFAVCMQDFICTRTYAQFTYVCTNVYASVRACGEGLQRKGCCLET